MQNEIQPVAPPVTPENSSPEALHAMASNYLNSPHGQLHSTLHAMHNAAKAGNFEVTPGRLSNSTVTHLKGMGHQVHENGSQSHTIKWHTPKH